MTRTRIVLLAAAVAVLVALAWSARPQPASAAERVDRIAAELRCPVCQGLSARDSPSETAREMRDLVAARVAEGRTDDEIRAEFRRSYGEWVLLSPPVLGPSGLVWVAPLVVVAIGAAVALARARAPAAGGPAPRGEELETLRRRVLEEELREG